MAITNQILQAGLRQLNNKYKVRTTLQMLNGNPVYLMHGNSPNPPQGLPGKIQVPDQYGKVATLPIIWAGQPAPKRLPVLNERDLDLNLWAGGVPITRRDRVTEYQPGDPDYTPLVGPIPTANTKDMSVSLDVSTAGDHGWWDINFDLDSEICCPFFAQQNIILTYRVPEDRCVYLDSWGFMFYSTAVVGWTFNVMFKRDGETLLSYDEVVVDPTNPDPGKRCLFSGPTEPVMYAPMRIDRNQVLTVVITPKGLFPFTGTPFDTFCGNISVLLHGHVTALLDNRDGYPRPKDVGGMRDDLTGDGALDTSTPNAALNAVTAEDVQSLMYWMNNATNDVATQTVDDEPMAVETPSSAPPAEKNNWLWFLLATGAAISLGDGQMDDIYGSSLDIEEFQNSSTDNDPYSL